MRHSGLQYGSITNRWRKPPLPNGNGLNYIVRYQSVLYNKFNILNISYESGNDGHKFPQKIMYLKSI